MRFLLSSFGLLMALFSPVAPVWAAAEEEPIAAIAATVNGQPISYYDLDQYIRLNLAISSQEWTEENAAAIRERSMENLIEDRLQIQEAHRQGITVSNREIGDSLNNLIQSSGMGQRELENYMTSRGISLDTLRTHLAADLAWNKLVRQRIAPRILIRPNQVAEMFERNQERAGQTSYLLSEIFIGFTDALDAGEKRAITAQLRGQLAAGAPFALAAGQFSESPSASAGGNIGWIAEPALPDAWRQPLAGLTPGELSQPIRTDDGYYILYLRDRHLGEEDSRERGQVRLLAVRFPAALTQDDAGEHARSLEDDFTNCEGTLEKAGEAGSEYEDFGFIAVNNLSPELRKTITAAPTGKAVRTEVGPQGADVLFLCARKEEQRKQMSREEIEYTLLNQEVSIRARQHLRDLRRDSNIEMRW